MAEISPNRGDAKEVVALSALSREVLAPQSPYAGLGVILVSALAMLMAMGSSVLVISARMANTCPSEEQRAQLNLPVAESWHAAPATTPRATKPPCGTPVYQSHQDGSISVHYHACPGATMTAPVTVSSPATAASATTKPVTVQLRRTP